MLTLLVSVDDFPTPSQPSQTPSHIHNPFHTPSVLSKLRFSSSNSYSSLPMHITSHPSHSFGLSLQRYGSTILGHRTYRWQARAARLFRYQLSKDVGRLYNANSSLRKARLAEIQRRQTEPGFWPPSLTQVDESRETETFSPWTPQYCNQQEANSSTLLDRNPKIRRVLRPRRQVLPLTHLDESGSARMVSIAHKRNTVRCAVAIATLFFSKAATSNSIVSASTEKGDVFAVSRIAAIQAAKQTSNLIPLAHPGLGITAIDVDLRLLDGRYKEDRPKGRHVHGGVSVIVRILCEGKTGVEMEAMTAATVGCLTLYDMLKGIDKNMIISGAKVLEKRGGKSGNWVWDHTEGMLVNVDENDDESAEPAGGTTKIPENVSETPKFKTRSSAERHEPADEALSEINPQTEETTTGEIEEWNRGLADEFSTASSAQAAGKTSEATERKQNENLQQYNPPNLDPAGAANEAVESDVGQASSGNQVKYSAISEPGLKAPLRPITGGTGLPSDNYSLKTEDQPKEDAAQVTRDMISNYAVQRQVDAKDFEKARVKRYTDWMSSH